jgi:thioesterase domain-containing protein
MGDMLNLPPVLERVREASGEAFVSYRPPQYDGAVLFLRATEHSEREADPLPMWQPVAAQVDVVDVPGSHFALIEKPAAEHVAAILRRRLSDGGTQKKSDR